MNASVRPSWLFTAGVLSLAAAWAFSPLRRSSIEVPDLTVGEATAKSASSIDVSAFRAPLWVAPPARPVPPVIEPPAPPAPLRLELIAVIDDNNGFSAVMYDPDADRLLVVSPGETLAEGRTIERVTNGGVVIRAEDGVHTLALHAGRSP